MGRLESRFPISRRLRNLGLRPSAFVDVGSVWKYDQPDLIDIPGTASDRLPSTPTVLNALPSAATGAAKCLRQSQAVQRRFIRTSPTRGFKEFFRGNSAKPRLSIGVGVNWVSPFGPLRIDIAKALLKQEGDETKLFSFNVGTQF